MDESVQRQAKKLRTQLEQCAKEFRIHGQMYAKTDSAKTMAEFDALVCEDSAEMLAKLGTEVIRLRLCIQHFDHGQMSRFELRDTVKNWNNDPPGTPEITNRAEKFMRESK